MVPVILSFLFPLALSPPKYSRPRGGFLQDFIFIFKEKQVHLWYRRWITGLYGLERSTQRHGFEIEYLDTDTPYFLLNVSYIFKFVGTCLTSRVTPGNLTARYGPLTAKNGLTAGNCRYLPERRFFMTRTIHEVLTSIRHVFKHPKKFPPAQEGYPQMTTATCKCRCSACLGTTDFVSYIRRRKWWTQSYANGQW